MKKTYLLLIAIFIIAVNAIAQKKLNIGVESGAAFPVDNIYLETGYFIKLNTTYRLDKKSLLNLVMAYDAFNGKDTKSQLPNSTFESINGDLKVFRLGVGFLYSFSLKLSAGCEFGFTIPETGDSRYVQRNTGSNGGSVFIHTADANNYQEGGAKTFAGFQLGYNIMRDLKINLSYNYLNQVYGITALNEEVKNLSYVGISLQYLIVR